MKSVKNTLVVLVLIINLKNFCAAENCDKYGVLVYEDIACRPVSTAENKCPSQYDCNFSQSKSGCLFKGKNFGSREEIPSDLTYSACSIGCSCNDLNSIRCAILDCPEYFGFNLKFGCYHEYQLGKCCSIGSICNSTETKTCEVDGKKYLLGQKFYPQNTCYNCVCHKEFTGEYDEKTCIRSNCNSQIHYSSEITQNCAAAYFDPGEVLCCPDHFVCPDAADKIEVVNPNAEKNSSLECLYGEKKLKLGDGLIRTVNKYGKDRNLQCECKIPPFLTCKEI